MGTPGRLLDLIEKGHLELKNLKMLVIDEVDHLLGRSFEETIDKLEEYVPEDTQICLFSATLPPNQLETCRELTNNPVEILVPVDELTLKGIKQYNITIEKEEWKMETLLGLFEHLEFSKAMIFVNKKDDVIELANELEKAEQKVSYICGGMKGYERNQ